MHPRIKCLLKRRAFFWGSAGLFFFMPVFSFAQDDRVGEADLSGGEGSRAAKVSQALERESSVREERLMEKLTQELDRVEASPPSGSLPAEDPAEMLRRASAAYRQRRDYVNAIELTQRALRIDPGNFRAERLQERIQRDLKEHLTLFDYGEPYLLPEGVFAYRRAMSDGVITVEEAVDIALKNSVKLVSLKKHIDGAEGKVREARRSLFPTLKGQISVSGGIAVDAWTGEAFKLNFSQPAFYGWELIYTLRQAAANLESDRAKYQKEELDIIHKARESYYGVVKADYNMSYQGALVDEVTEIKDRVEKSYEQKLIPDVEYLEILSTYHQVQAQGETAITDFQSADLLFHQVLRLDPEKPVPVATDINYEEIAIDLDGIRTLAQQHNPDIRIKEKAVEGAYYGLKVFEAKRLPRVDLRGNAGWAGEVRVDHGTSPDIEKEHAIFVDVSMPVGPHSAEYKFSRRFFWTHHPCPHGFAGF